MSASRDIWGMIGKRLAIVVPVEVTRQSNVAQGDSDELTGVMRLVKDLR